MTNEEIENIKVGDVIKLKVTPPIQYYWQCDVDEIVYSVTQVSKDSILTKCCIGGVEYSYIILKKTLENENYESVI